MVYHIRTKNPITDLVTRTQIGNQLGRKVLFPRIGEMVNDELGKEVLAKHSEKFGDNGLVDENTYGKNEPITHVSPILVLSYDSIIRNIDENMHLVTPEDYIRLGMNVPNRNEIYGITNAVIAYCEEGSNEELRRQVLDITGRTNTDVNLVVLGLGVKNTDDETGFGFEETPYMKVYQCKIEENEIDNYEDGTIKYEVLTVTIDNLKATITTPGVNIVDSEDVLRLNGASGLRAIHYTPGRMDDTFRGDFECLNKITSTSAGRVHIVQAA